MASIAVLVASFWYISMYKIELNLALKHSRYDMSTTTSGDFTVEIKLPPSIFESWRLKQGLLKTTQLNLPYNLRNRHK